MKTTPRERGVNPPLQLLLPLNLTIVESCVAELAQVLAEASIRPSSSRTCPSGPLIFDEKRGLRNLLGELRILYSLVSRAAH
jgi:hypothetical protein